MSTCVLLVGLCIGCGSSLKRVDEVSVVVGLLSPHERTALEVFFRALLGQSQGGYVLYGTKPACIESFAHREAGSIFLDPWIHLFSTELKEGALLWKKLQLNKYCKNYLLYVYEDPTNEWQDVLLLNKKEGLRIVQANLPLFQYVLGPKVTPTQLLNQLTQPGETFSSVTRGDKVLIGILLGYGTQNALHGARIENMKESHAEPVSFGFHTASEEVAWLNTKFVLSTQLSDVQFPALPWFGCFEPHETKPLIAQYKKTQKKIAAVLQSKNFLKEVLSTLFEIELSPLDATKEDGPILPERAELTKIVTQSIWHSIAEKTTEYITPFCQGMEASQQDAFPLPEKEFCDLRVQFCAAQQQVSSTPLDALALQNVSRLRHDLAYYSGLRVWNHLKQGEDLYVFSEIMNALSQLQKGQTTDSPPESQMDVILTRLDWLLYRKAGAFAQVHDSIFEARSVYTP